MSQCTLVSSIVLCAIFVSRAQTAASNKQRQTGEWEQIRTGGEFMNFLGKSVTLIWCVFLHFGFVSYVLQVLCVHSGSLKMSNKCYIYNNCNKLL